MVKVLLVIMRLLRNAALFELIGSVLIIVAVYLLAGLAWALGAAGALCLLKSLDLSLASEKD